MQYTEIFSSIKIENLKEKEKDIFNICVQNIGCGTCGYMLELPRSEAVLTSTHNLCF